jgi:hypothetical protein
MTVPPHAIRPELRLEFPVIAINKLISSGWDSPPCGYGLESWQVQKSQICTGPA